MALPPAKPFAVAFDPSNSVCSSTFYLPNGTYDQPSGIFGYSITGASLTLTGYIPQRGAMSPRPDATTFTTPQATAETAFSRAVSKLNQDRSAAGIFSISIPATVAEPPAACFFTKPQYRGDVFCIGPGGANFSGAEANVAQSVGVYGGATAWIYALAYGDAGGQKLSASVPDLSTEPYGTGGNFGGKVVGAWIYGI